MKLIDMIFGKKEAQKVEINTIDEVNENFVCIPSDPINSMNDLREGDWNMDKVRESFTMGMLRYAKQSEVDKAKEIGRIKSLVNATR